MTASEPLIVERRGEVVYLTMNRPGVLNALSVDLETAIINALEEIRHSDEIRVVVLRGAGRAFCAGADLKERVDSPPADVDEILDSYHHHSAFMRVWSLDKVMIAAIHGYCLGGANHLAGLADISVVTTSATLGDPEIRFGNPLLVPILPHLTGAKAARKMLYLGEYIDGSEAARLGLVSAEASEESFDRTVQALAEQLATIPAGGVVTAKRAWNYAVERMGLRRAAAINAELLGMTFAGAGGPVPERFAQRSSPSSAGQPTETARRSAAMTHTESAADNVLVPRTEGPVRILTLNRPEVLNALSPQLLARLDAELAVAVADEAIGAVVITGAGRAFSAGIDLKIPDEQWPFQDGRRHLDWLMRRCLSFWEAPIPIVAAVNGYALGHACDLAAVCDFTIASTHARFGVPEVRHVGGVAAMIYPYIMPMKQGRRFLYLGETWDAETSHAAGLVTDVVGPDELLSTSIDIATKLCAIPPAALRQMKRAVNRSYELMGLRDTLEYNLESLSLALAHQDPAELREREGLIREHGLGTFLRQRDEPFRSTR
ncbi:MAG: enoyl-CoA hydratase/isomerase family protein [Actinomycetota bacterium]|nr:enoyl-CoA hydratase/isomerase family protein [Actinomycetota bacterium]